MLAEERLDDLDGLAAHDPSGMLPMVASAGAQVREAVALCEEVGLARLREDGRPRAVVIAGLGTSGMTGDLLAGLAGAACPVPVVTWRERGLPLWVGAADAVITVSRSGRGEEAIIAADTALRRGARVVTVGAAGSALAERSAQGRAVHVPVSARRPARASFWALAVPVLLAGRELGLLRLDDADLEAAAVRLATVATTCRPDADAFVNPGKALAVGIGGSVPLVWGTSPVTSLAAQRFTDQLAATAKYPAVLGSLPEVSRTQVATFDGLFGAAAGAGTPGDPDDFFRDREDEAEPVRLRLVLLRDVAGAEEASAAHRADAVVVLARSRGIGVEELRAEGASPLERLASLVGVTDFAAAYLAILTGVDPSALAVVEELKKMVAR